MNVSSRYGYERTVRRCTLTWNLRSTSYHSLLILVYARPMLYTSNQCIHLSFFLFLFSIIWSPVIFCNYWITYGVSAPLYTRMTLNTHSICFKIPIVSVWNASSGFRYLKLYMRSVKYLEWLIAGRFYCKNVSDWLDVVLFFFLFIFLFSLFSTVPICDHWNGLAAHTFSTDSKTRRWSSLHTKSTSIWWYLQQPRIFYWMCLCLMLFWVIRANNKFWFLFTHFWNIYCVSFAV